MAYLFFLYLYRALSTAIIAFYSFFSIYFLATSDWTDRMGQAWFNASVSSLNLFQVVMERYLHLNIIWDNVIVPWLLLPVWAAIIIFIIIGVIKLWVLRLIFQKIL
ncbi:MAG: hypothetical protein QM529_03490 [Hydrotalea sp.]|nr:hypothetical protein [Hydrotalea sp.]